MALHDTVVRHITNWHEEKGDAVTAELRGYQKPPRCQGSRGRAYIPDVYVFNRRVAYEVKQYLAYRYAGPKLKAIAASHRLAKLVLVLCSGTPSGVSRVQNFMEDSGVEC